MTHADDIRHLEHAIDLAAQAREAGNHPFGAVVVTADGRVVEGVNTVVTGNDPTGHAETNLVRNAAAVLSEEELAGSTLYTSTEPCAMCAGAIYWSGIKRMVFALGEKQLEELIPDQDGAPHLDLPSREVFARGRGPVEVVGPVELPRAREVHAGFWE